MTTSEDYTCSNCGAALGAMLPETCPSCNQPTTDANPPAASEHDASPDPDVAGMTPEPGDVCIKNGCEKPAVGWFADIRGKRRPICAECAHGSNHAVTRFAPLTLEGLDREVTMLAAALRRALARIETLEGRMLRAEIACRETNTSVHSLQEHARVVNSVPAIRARVERYTEQKSTERQLPPPAPAYRGDPVYADYKTSVESDRERGGRSGR